MSIILLPLALLVVAVHAGLMLRQRLMIRRHWLTTPARIVSLRSTPAASSEGAHLWSFTTITFEFPAHGAHYSVRQSFVGSLNAELRSPISIYYNPDDPHQASIDLSTSMIASRIVLEFLLGVGLSILLGACLLPLR